MQWPRSSRGGSLVAVAMLAAVGVLTVRALTDAHRLQARKHPSRIVLVSYNGERLPDFFAGLKPIPAYLNGKMFKMKKAARPGCEKKSGFLYRAATALGLEKVVYAQGGCDAAGCTGCYLKTVEYSCAGACEDGQYYYDVQGGGSTCWLGFDFTGPSCGADNGCGCNLQATCSNYNSCGCSD